MTLMFELQPLTTASRKIFRLTAAGFRAHTAAIISFSIGLPRDHLRREFPFRFRGYFFALFFLVF